MSEELVIAARENLKRLILLYESIIYNHEETEM